MPKEASSLFSTLSYAWLPRFRWPKIFLCKMCKKSCSEIICEGSLLWDEVESLLCSNDKFFSLRKRRGFLISVSSGGTAHCVWIFNIIVKRGSSLFGVGPWNSGIHISVDAITFQLQILLIIQNSNTEWSRHQPTWPRIGNSVLVLPGYKRSGLFFSLWNENWLEKRGLGFSCRLMRRFGSFNALNADLSAERKADVTLSVFKDQL